MYLYLSGKTGRNAIKAKCCILEITTAAASFGIGVQDLPAEPLPIQKRTTGHKVLGDMTGCWRSLNTGAMLQFWMTQHKVSMTAQGLGPHSSVQHKCLFLQVNLQETMWNWTEGSPCARLMTHLEAGCSSIFTGTEEWTVQKLGLAFPKVFTEKICQISFQVQILISCLSLSDTQCAEWMLWWWFISTVYLRDTLLLGKSLFCSQFQWKRGKKERLRKGEGK